MRALVCRQWCDFNDLLIEEVPSPELRAGCVRIKVSYGSVSFATSLIVSGKYQRKPPLPFVPGTEVAGVITEIAPGVSRFKPGDKVLAILDWGGLAEEAIATEETVYPLPDGLDLKSSIHLPLSYGTAYGALDWRARLQPGEILLVHGAAGGVGLAATELGRRLGARVIACAGTPEKRETALAHGADFVLPSGEFREQVKEFTSGRGADVIFDPVGGDVFDESLRCIAQEGRILAIGFASGRVPQIPANILLVKNVAVMGFNFGTYVGWGLSDERKIHAQRVQSMMGRLFAWALAGELSPTSSVFPFEESRKAMDMVLSRRGAGKIVLQITEEMKK